MITKICIVKDCSKPKIAKGYCQGHYRRYKKGTDINAPMRHLNEQPFCTLTFCNEKYFAKGLCQAHYQRKLDGVPLDKPVRKITNKNRHPLFSTWQGMHNRCKYPNSMSYKNYGGRGIKVCERWENFWNFVEDMGEKPTPKHTLDRINNDGDYTPDNCRWATRIEQYHNRRKEK